MFDEGGYNGDMRVELDLTRHVDDDQIFLREWVERFGEEIEVFQEELETVDQTAVGSQSHFGHDVLERDEVFDVEVGLVRELFGGRVQVDIET